MATFKDEIEKICQEVVERFEGWEYRRGEFLNNRLKHTILTLLPGFSFMHGTTPICPSLVIKNKKVTRICREIIGAELWTSQIRFDYVEGFQGKFKREWVNATIVPEKVEFFRLAPEASKRADRYISLSDVREVIFALMEDGVEMIDSYYDLSSEENLFRGLPPKYAPHYSHDFPPGLSSTNGIATCMARICVGDFDFFDWYRSDECKTVLPKNVIAIDKIAKALPELKRRFGRTGKVS